MVSIYTVKPGKTGTIWFAAPNPGGVQRLDIKPNQPWWVQFDGFICGGNVKVEAKIPKELKAAAFGGEGVLMQYITTEGDQDGIAFIDGGGSILPLDLKEGETIKVDTGCVMAFQDSVKYSADFVLDPGMLKDWRRLKNGLLQAMLGGEGIVFATLTGPGRCYIESLPHARRRGRMQDETKEGSGANITEQLAGLIRTIGSQK